MDPDDVATNTLITILRVAKRTPPQHTPARERRVRQILKATQTSARWGLARGPRLSELPPLSSTEALPLPGAAQAPRALPAIGQGIFGDLSGQ